MNLALEHGTGVATYARNLSFALGELGCEVSLLYGRAIGDGDDLLREIAFFDPLEQRPPRWLRRIRNYTSVPRALAGVAARPIPLTGAVVADELRPRLPHLDRLLNSPSLFQLAHNYFHAFGAMLKVRVPRPPRVMHWTYPLPIQVVGAKNIYTMHDLVPLRLPYTTLDVKKKYLALMRMLASKADHLVTVSETSKRDIIDLLKIPESHITNTYQSAELPAAVTGRSEADIRREVEGIFGLEHRGYFLFFGAIEPKKNVNRLIQAYLAADVSTPLVLVGKRAWKSEQELALLKFDDMRAALAARREGGSGSRIIQIDYVAFPLLMSLVQGAKAVLFPSLYEGFGLPVLEAMSLGVPVITSTTSSLPELAGNAALLVDPYNPQELTQAIRRIDADRELRTELAGRGPNQAALFSKDAYKVRLKTLYERVGVSL